MCRGPGFIFLPFYPEGFPLLPVLSPSISGIAAEHMQVLGFPSPPCYGTEFPTQPPTDQIEGFFLINLSSLFTLHNYWLSCSTELDGWWPRYVPCLHTDTWKHPDVFSKEKSFAQTALAVSSSTQRTRAVCQPCEALAWCKLAQVIKAGQGVKARCHQLEQVFKQGNNILARATEQPQRKAEKS